MSAHEEAAEILSHYFRSLARAAGVKWTAANDADIARVAELLGDGDLPEIPSFAQVDEAEELRPARPAARPQTQKGSITPTTQPEDDREYLRRIAAAHGLPTKKGRAA